MISIYGILMSYHSNLYEIRHKRLCLAFAFVVLGIVLELIQGRTDYRTFDPKDVIANTAGVLLRLIFAPPRTP